jgi:hypothetical protein
VGDVILRPSSRGLMNLSLTLKIFDGVCTHVDIKEGGKDAQNSANNLRLGSPLHIGDEQYEDLDEVRPLRDAEGSLGDAKEIVTFRGFGAIAREIVSRRPSIPLYPIVARTHMYTYDRLGFVRRSRTRVCRAVPNPLRFATFSSPI